jgi:hypothetical protein
MLARVRRAARHGSRRAIRIGAVAHDQDARFTPQQSL